MTVPYLTMCKSTIRSLRLTHRMGPKRLQDCELVFESLLRYSKAGSAHVATAGTCSTGVLGES